MAKPRPKAVGDRARGSWERLRLTGPTRSRFANLSRAAAPEGFFVASAAARFDCTELGNSRAWWRTGDPDPGIGHALSRAGPKRGARRRERRASDRAVHRWR